MNFIQFMENKKQAEMLVKQGKISQEIFDIIVNSDPTPTKKFTGWMAQQWALGNVDNIDLLRNTIEEFNSFIERNRTKKRDLYQYKSFKELKSEVDELNNEGDISVSELENDYEIIRDDEKLLVMVPHTHEASRKLGLSKFAYRKCGEGKDSAWCTTYKAPNHFNDIYYNNNITFYYIKVNSTIIQNQLKEEGFNEPYFVVALLVDENGIKEAYDGNDKKFKGKELIRYLNIIGLK